MRNPHAAQPECVALALDVVNAWSVERHGQFGPRSGVVPSTEALQLFCIASSSKGYTLGQLFSHRTTVALPAYRYRFRQALQRWLARPQPQKIPGGPLVLLTDGLWFEFEGIPWVLYLVALKPCRGHQATFLDPLLLPGREGASRWQQAVEAIPSPARKRIRAIVADNLPGIEKIAHQHRLVLQLCHFHLLLKLQAPRRRVRYALRGGSPAAHRDLQWAADQQNFLTHPHFA